MADMMTIREKGFAKLETKLTKLLPATAKKVVRKAVRKGAKPVQKAGRENAVSMVGGEMGALLKKHLIIRAFKKQRRGQFGVQVRLRPEVAEFVEVSKDGKRNYIPSAIEYGHISAGGFVGPIPFMRTASDTQLANAAAIIKAEIITGILKAA